MSDPQTIFDEAVRVAAGGGAFVAHDLADALRTLGKTWLDFHEAVAAERFR